MTKEEKLSYFKEEIELIQSADLKVFLRIAVENMFDYVFTKPASSSGKYHPMSDLGEGGLIRHIKGVFYLGYDMLNLEQNAHLFTQREKDMILIAIILHDSWKCGNGTENRVHTVVEHPMLAAAWVEEDEIFDNVISFEDRIFIGACIASHSGQWNTNRKGEEILPKPINDCQKFVHLCDYIASRRYLNFDFSAVNTKVDKIIEPKDYVITFGKKHNGHTLQQIYDIDYDYLVWASQNLKAEPAHTYIQKFLAELAETEF